MMRKPLLAMATIGLFGLSACSTDTAAPSGLDAFDSGVVDLVPDYALSPAAEIDGAGVGASLLPESLRLTADQKAEIAALHEAFVQAHAEDVAALRALERQLRNLRRTGGTREQRQAILAEARVILDRLAADFAELQNAIWAVYTDAQRAWIESHRPKVCGPEGPPKLTEEQVAQIRALREQFVASIQSDLALVKQIHLDARAAHTAGATLEEVRAILATAREPLDRIRAAELQLRVDIRAVLTPEQLADWCIVRRHVVPLRHG